MGKLMCGVAALAALMLWQAPPVQAADRGGPSAMPALPGPLSHAVMDCYMHYANGDVDYIVAQTTDDVVWGGTGGELAPLAQYTGHAGVRRWFKELGLDNSGYQLTDLEFHEDATTVTVTGNQSTTFTSTGKTETGPFCHVFKFRGGQVFWYGNYVDSYTMRQAGYGSTGTMTSMSTADQNIATVQAAYAAYGEGDLDKLLTYFTDDITWEENAPAGAFPLYGTFHGKQEVRRWFEGLGQMLELQPFTNTQFIGSGDTVILMGDNSAVVRSTGKSVSGHFVHVLKLRDGKVYWFREFEDTASFLAATK